MPPFLPAISIRKCAKLEKVVWSGIPLSLTLSLQGEGTDRFSARFRKDFRRERGQPLLGKSYEWVSFA